MYQILVSSYKSLNTNKTNNFYSELIHNLGVSKNVNNWKEIYILNMNFK